MSSPLLYWIKVASANTELGGSEVPALMPCRRRDLVAQARLLPGTVAVVEMLERLPSVTVLGRVICSKQSVVWNGLIATIAVSSKRLGAALTEQVLLPYDVPFGDTTSPRPLRAPR